MTEYFSFLIRIGAPPRTMAVRHEKDGGAVDRKWRLLISVVSGLAAAGLFALYSAQMQSQVEQERREALERYGGETVSVCVAARGIDPGESLDEDNVRVEEWVPGLLPEDALTSLRDVVGRTATSRIPKHAAISSAYFERRDHDSEVPKGTVAIAVPTDSEHAVGGSLKRGETVDVYVVKDGVSNRLCSAEVLDTSSLANGGGSLEWVTLAVKAESSHEVLSATAIGPLSIVRPGPAAEEGE